ncbi:MAG: class I SAM-dependent methyltransferase [Rhodospirillales bacterium]|nr:class I SAM-dependent methyltransferase [Rhodospirillales bacterium]
MSGFSAEWLALRAGADRQARAPLLLRAVRHRLAGRQAYGKPLHIVDLGAGTGGTLRLLAPLLPSPQSWRLIDNDATLLASATRLPRRGKQIVVRRLCADLADTRRLPELLRGGDLITASALFDLVSEDWCRQLLGAAACPGVTFYAALTYDGRVVLHPPDPFDAVALALFDQHQHADKGFGHALGPGARAALVRIAAASGAVVRTARSDWRLTPGDAHLLQLLVSGWAEAAREIEPEATEAINSWMARRFEAIKARCLRARVGHRDVLACW